MALIATEVSGQTSELAQRFRAAEPFRHVVIENFLEPNLCASLLDGFPAFEDRHALNEMGKVGGKAVRMDVRDISDAYRGLDHYLQSPEFLGFVSSVTGIPDLLYDPDYIGGGTHENRHGQGLDAHVDFNFHPRTRWHRRLNLIVYLNEEWQSSWGGELELHSDPWDAAANRSISIPPLFNTAVIFETNEISWHGFSQIDLPEDRRGISRKSFAIYLYTIDRPAQETAPRHSTIYVPETMPAGWAAGRVLDDADVRGLGMRFSRLKTQLRYLYDREKQFGAQMAALEYAAREARDALRLEIQGFAIQRDAPTGMWPDRWVGTDFSVTIELTRKAKNLTLELWAPPGLGAEQELRIDVAGKIFTHSMQTGTRVRVMIPLRLGKGEAFVLHVRALHAWIPAQGQPDGDQRSLAYRVMGAIIDG